MRGRCMTRSDSTRIDAPLGALIRFVGLTLLLSWGVFLPVVLGFVPVERATPLVVSSIFGPSVAALVLTWRTDGTVGVRRLLARLVRVRVTLRWYAATLLPVVLGVLGWGILRATGRASALGQFGGDLASLPLPVIVAMFLTSCLGSGALAEELGWRGYALIRLQVPRFEQISQHCHRLAFVN
jgi:membrane protease YdiL (CAAX protease family)